MATDSDYIVGYTNKSVTRNNGKDFLVYREGSGGTIEIFEILVQSDRRVGTGTKLIEQLISENPDKKIFAFTRYENVNARKFYIKNGFMEIAIRNFYPDGDAVLVWR